MLKDDQQENVQLEIRKFVEDVYAYLNMLRDKSNLCDDGKQYISEPPPGELINQCEHILNIIQLNQQELLNIKSHNSITIEQDQYLDMSANNFKINSNEYVDIKIPKNFDQNEENSDLYDQCRSSGSTIYRTATTDGEQSSESHRKSCPFGGLPAAHLKIKKSQKIGTLIRHERRIFFNQTKKYFAGILDGWLLLYIGGPTDLKPTLCIPLNRCNLNQYHQSSTVSTGTDSTDNAANAVVGKKKDLIFQLTLPTQQNANSNSGGDPGKKYYFQANSNTDLEEWLKAIADNTKENDIYEQQQSRRLPTPPIPQNIYQNQRFSYRSEDIYEEPNEMVTAKSTLKLKIVPDYDIPKSPPKRVVSDIEQDEYQQKINDVKTKLSTQLPNAAATHQATYTTSPNNSKKTKDNEQLETSSNPQIINQTPIKSWLFNRLSRSSATSTKNSNKINKNDEVSVQCSRSSSVTTSTILSSGKLTGKGGKVNMIINQLEANGHLPLLGKANKRYAGTATIIESNLDYDEHNYEPVSMTRVK